MSTGFDLPEIGRKGLRDFALTMGGIIAGLFGLVLPWLFDAPFPIWPWIVAGIFWVWGLIKPESLRLVYRTWMRLGLLLNKITSPIVLGIAFYGILAPLALIRRALKKDPLPKKRDASLDSYRVPSTKRDKTQLERPF